ncbi:MAG: hypothetical protein K8T91_04935 [Planctomycetes bacterium]|nr:hypothetical protein [Planctomycetota bacterium]
MRVEYSQLPLIKEYHVIRQIPTDVQERLQARFAEGSYQSEDDVLRDALDALDQLEQEKVTHWNERNRFSTQQSEQGASGPLDDQKFLARLRERLAREGILS